MELGPAYLAIFGVVTTLVLLIVFTLMQRVLYAQAVSDDLNTGNVARRLLRVGQVFAVFMVSATVVKNGVTGESVTHDVTWVAAFGLTAVTLVSLTGRLGVQLLLSSRLPAELTRGNVAAGVAAAANYIATGIVTARAIGGTDLHGLGVSLVFFALSQVTLHLFSLLFRMLTTYDDAEQIAGENVAAALSYGGLQVAVALVVAHAVEGDFVGWDASVRGYGKALIALVAFYPVRQIFVQMVLLRAPFALRGGRLDVAVGAERNAGMGALEAATYVSTALAISQLG
jgi:uncharacterized membrane protein YjfL (UPF0719 family)